MIASSSAREPEFVRRTPYERQITSLAFMPTVSLRRKRVRDSARVAGYESLLDLFTLISFVLILSALLYVGVARGPDNPSSSVLAEIAERGSASPQTLPVDLLLLVIHRQSNVDKLTLLDGGGGHPVTLNVTEEGVSETLDKVRAMFERGKKIQVAIHRGRDGAVSAGIYLRLSEWLAKRGHGEFRVYHSGKLE